MNAILDKEKIWEEIEKLSLEEQIELMEKLLSYLKSRVIIKRDFPDWDEIYGIGMGLWEEDAQDYINKLREDR